MKRLSLLFTAIMAALVLSACSSSADSSEVVASTSEGDVTKEELYNKLVDQYGDAALKELLYDEVLSEQYSISDEEVQKEINKLKESYGDQFESVLQQNGFSSEEDLKNIIRSSMLKEKAATADVEVTDEEVKEYYENMKQEVKASHILVEDKETADEVKQKLEDGDDFATLAKEYSTDSSSAENGGDVGYFSVGEMVPAFEQKAYEMEAGQVSDPVQSDYGYHIIKVEDKREKEDTSSIGSFEEMEDQLRQQLKTSKADPNTLADIMKDANIDIKIDDLKDKISFEEATSTPQP
ncbi:peptidylprolyl isomerase [Pontibacillus salicampi]|uniref:Foldase protein PrsA n=1 Tax=Pontibacillus salicampi TaxID=1449801 RepID=A0ABV6LPK5_9BACI